VLDWLLLEELLTVGETMLCFGGSEPEDATDAVLEVVVLLGVEEAGAVGGTISEAAGKVPLDATLVEVDELEELGGVGNTMSEEAGRPPLEATELGVADVSTLVDDGDDNIVLAIGELDEVVVRDAVGPAVVVVLASEGTMDKLEVDELVVDELVVATLLVVVLGDVLGGVGATITEGSPLEGIYDELELVARLLVDDEVVKLLLELDVVNDVVLAVLDVLVVLTVLDDAVGGTIGPKNPVEPML